MVKFLILINLLITACSYEIIITTKYFSSYNYYNVLYYYIAAFPNYVYFNGYQIYECNYDCQY